MALSLANLVQQVKRKTHYGDINSITDQITADIVHYINQRRFRIWRKYPWHWIIKEFTIPIQAGIVNYTIDAEIGDIIAIDNNHGGYLKKLTLKRYLEWFKGGGNSSEDTGIISRYILMGRDPSTKALTIKIWKTPASNETLTGWGKKRIERYSVNNISTNTDIEYFPEEVLDVLEQGVIADIYEAQNRLDMSMAKEKFFMDELHRMVNEATMEEDVEEETPPPDYFMFHYRKRNGTTVT